MPHLVGSRLFSRVHPYIRTAMAALLVAWPLSQSPQANEIGLAEGYPDRYVVKEGDTLWGIAQQFLVEPWHWPLIWRDNNEVENPHLIYPGDVLVMTADGIRLLRRESLKQKVVKLSPTIRYDSLESAIPTIPPNVIQPFLSSSMLINEDELEDAAYVTEGVEKNIVLGKLSKFYARGIGDSDEEIYQVFRPQNELKHPETNEVLGYEAHYLGDARLLRAGDPAKFEMTSSTQEITPGDRIVPADSSLALPYYFPHAPEGAPRGFILSTLNGVAEVGSHSVVTISLGERDGIETGHVLRIMRRGGQGKDPVTKKLYDIPPESSGLVMIFRTFDKASYGLIMTGSRSIHMQDMVVAP